MTDLDRSPVPQPVDARRGATAPALYDLANDVGETADYAADHPDLVRKLTAEWQRWNRDNVDPRWVPPGFRKQPTPKGVPPNAAPAAQPVDDEK